MTTKIEGKNVSGGTLPISQLSVPNAEILNNETLEFTLWNTVAEIQNDPQLLTYVSDGDIQLIVDDVIQTIPQGVSVLSTVVSDESTPFSVKKGSAGTINAGQAVRITGYDPTDELTEVELADASSESTMPSLGIAKTEITDTIPGQIITLGQLVGIDTSSFSVGDKLYVSEAAGELTTGKPTGAATIQKVAEVARSHATEGVLQIFGAGRTNDVPNIPSAKLWLGDGSGVATPVTLSGDATIDNTGNVTINAELADLTDVDSSVSSAAESDILIRGSSDWIRLKNNYSATSAPTSTDDSAAGYAIGSRWVDVSADKEYVCLDSTATSAVWTETTQSSGGSGGWTDDGSVVRLTTSTDSVGIGTASPAGIFQVTSGAVGSTNHIQQTIHTNANTDDYNLNIDTGDSSGVTFSAEDGTSRQAVVMLADTGNNAKTIFGVSKSSDSGSTWDPQFAVTLGNGVGVGKTNPTEKLDVLGKTQSSDQFLGSDGTKPLPGYAFTNANDTGMWLEPTGDLSFSVGGQEIFEVQTDGRCIISADTPNYETLVTADNVIPNKKYVDDLLDYKVQHKFTADSLNSPNNNEWAVQDFASLSSDTNNSALRIRRFDDTTEEGIGFTLEVPSGATNINFKLRSRAETAPGSTKTVSLKLYHREMPDNAAVGSWSAGSNFADLSMPANEYWQYDEEQFTLSSLSITAGSVYQFELTRDGVGTLAGDWTLLLLLVEFN